MTLHRQFFAIFLLLSAVPAFAGSPRLSNLLPVAGQRGQAVKVTFYGDRLEDAAEILFHTKGITAGELEIDDNKRIKTTLTIAADAPLGEHQMRVRTRTGVTEMITFRVIDRPIVQEERDERVKDSNRFTQSTSFDQPQVVEMGTTVLGRTESEDVDYYAVDLKKGERLTVQIDGMSLGRGFTDSYLAVLNDERFEVAVSDDTSLLRQDPYVSLLAPKDGRYVIVIRDSGYEGDNNNWYLLHVGGFPRPAVVYPLGGRPGEQVKLRFIGDVAGDLYQQVTLPDRTDDHFIVTPERDGRPAPSGHAFRVNDLPNVYEDPAVANDAIRDMQDVEAPSVPVALNGVIERPGDIDFYKIRLTKGQQLTVHCYASSMGSPLDSVVNVFQAKDNKHLLGNDDQGGPDSAVELTAPEDGDYLVRVRDHRGRGGEGFVYRLEATVQTPSLSTSIDRYDRNRPQERQAIAVPRGNRIAALVRVSRSEVGGDLTPVIEGLPSGVSFTGLGPAGGGGMMPVVFESSADAPLGAVLADIGAQGETKGDSAERIVGHFSQVTPTVLGDPNRTEYHHTTLDTMPIAVTESVPFRIEVAEPKAPLVRNGVMRLKISVTREEGFEGRVRLYMLWRPNGMGAAGQVDLNGDKTEAQYQLDANNNTGTRAWPLVIYGYGDVPGGPVWVSSELFEVRVEEPFVGGSIEKAKCTQGEAVDVVVQLDHNRDWSGEGEIRLLGLPAGCEVEPAKIRHGQDKAVFRVKTADNTPVGQHKSLMAELTLTINGEPVVHRLGQGGQLRIDRPKTKRDAQARKGGGE